MLYLYLRTCCACVCVLCVIVSSFEGSCKCTFVPCCPVRLLFDFTCFIAASLSDSNRKYGIKLYEQELEGSETLCKELWKES